MEPSDKERRRLAGSDFLIAHLMSLQLDRANVSRKLDGATRVEIWETATASHDVQVTLMQFDDAGQALRASIFESLQNAERWLAQR